MGILGGICGDFVSLRSIPTNKLFSRDSANGSDLACSWTLCEHMSIGDHIYSGICLKRTLSQPLFRNVKKKYKVLSNVLVLAKGE